MNTNILLATEIVKLKETSLSNHTPRPFIVLFVSSYSWALKVIVFGCLTHYNHCLQLGPLWRPERLFMFISGVKNCKYSYVKFSINNRINTGHKLQLWEIADFGRIRLFWWTSYCTYSFPFRICDYSSWTKSGDIQ